MRVQTKKKLEKVKQLTAQGMSIKDACKQVGLGRSTYDKNAFKTVIHNVETPRAPRSGKLAVVFGTIEQVRELLK